MTRFDGKEAFFSVFFIFLRRVLVGIFLAGGVVPPALAQETGKTSKEEAVTLPEEILDLPGLKDLPLNDLKKLGEDSYEAVLGGDKIEAFFYKRENAWEAAFLPGKNLNLDKLASGIGDSLLGRVSIPESAIIVTSRKGPLTPGGLPRPLGDFLNKLPKRTGGKEPSLSQGVNFLAGLDYSGSKELELLGQKLGIPKKAVLVSGSFDPSSLLIISGDKKERPTEQSDKNFSLAFQFPPLQLPHIPAIKSEPIDFSFSVKNRKAEATGDTKIDLDFLDHKLTFPTDITFRKPEGSELPFTVTGALELGKPGLARIPDFPGVEFLTHLMKLKLNGLQLDLGDSGDGKKEPGDKLPASLSILGKLSGKDIAFSMPVTKPQGDAPRVFSLSGSFTAEDFIPELGDVPGLKSISLSNLKFGKGLFTADSSVKKAKADVAVVRPEGESKSAVAFSLPDFKFSNFLPEDAGKLLDNIHIPDPGLAYIPKGMNTAGLKGISLPKGFPDMFSARGSEKTPTEKKSPANKGGGKNGNVRFFGHMDLGKSGKVGSLLGHLGIHDLSLPLTGSMDPAIFHEGGFTGEVRDLILSNLDLSIPLPALKPAGLPGGFAFKNPEFRLWGAKDDTGHGDAQGLTLKIGVTTGVTVKTGQTNPVELSTASFDFVGASEIEFSGKIDDPKDLISFEGLAVESAALDGRMDAKGWDVKFTGGLKLHTKTANFEADLEKGKGDAVQYVVKITDDLKASDILGVALSVPGIDDLAVTSAEVTNTFISATVKLKNESTTFVAYHPDPGSKIHLALIPGGFAFSDYIPELKGTPVDDAKLSDIAFVIVPKGEAKKGVAVAKLPDAMVTPIKAVAGETIDLGDGVNFFSMLDLNASGGLGSLMKDVGVPTSKTLPLTGAINPASFKQGGGGKAALSGLHLSMPIPNLSAIKGFPSFLKLKSPSFVISGPGGGDGGTDGKTGAKGAPAPKSKSGDGVTTGIATGLDFKIDGKTLSFNSLIDFSHKGGKGITISGLSPAKWDKPMGIPWLSLDGLNITAGAGADGKGGKDFSLDMQTLTSLGKHKDLGVDVDFDIDGGKIKDAFFKIAGDIELSEIPLLNKIPEANQFKLSNVEASIHGLTATSLFKKLKVSAAAFEASGGWNMALSLDNLNMGDLAPWVKKSILGKLTLQETAIVLSERGLQGQSSDLPMVAKPTMDDIFGKEGGILKIPDGLAVLSALESGKAGGLAKTLSGLGLPDRLVIMGAVGGLFGGPPSIDIAAELGALGNAKGLPKFMKGNGEAALFILMKAGNVDFGISTSFDVHTNKEVLTFVSALEIDASEEGIGVDVLGKMDGDWKKPFGIPGFELANLGLKVGITEDGAVTLGFEGTTVLGPEKVSMAAEVELLLEAEGFPQSVAFSGSLNKLEFLDLVALTESIAGLPKGKLDTSALPSFGFKDVALAFATPGATDPQLGLVSQGFAMKGAFNFMGEDLGKVDCAISPTAGLTVDGKIAPINLGPIDLKQNVLDIKVPLTALPHLKIASNIDIFGATQDLQVDFSLPTILFELEQKIAGLWNAKLVLAAIGIDLESGKLDPDADFIVDGELSVDFFDWLDHQAKDWVDARFNEMLAGLKEAEAKLKKAAVLKTDAYNALQKERAIVRKERKREENAISNAEARVNKLNGDISHAEHEHGRCHGWKKYPCRWYWDGVKDVEEAAKKVADAVLEAAKKALSAIPIDLDPRVAVKLTAYEATVVIWNAANILVEGLDDITNISKEVTDYILNGVGGSKAIVINKAAILGSLEGSIKNGDPLLLTLDYEIFGAASNNQFMLSLTDPVFDAKQLSLVTLNALEKLIDEVLKAVPKLIRNKLDSLIATGLSEVEALVEGNATKYQETFNALNKRVAQLHQKIEEFEAKQTQLYKSRSFANVPGSGPGYMPERLRPAPRQYAALAAETDAAPAPAVKSAAPAASGGGKPAGKGVTVKGITLSALTPVNLQSQASTISNRAKAMDEKVTQTHNELYSGNFNFADKEPPSAVFENELLEIGHSSHCLAIKPGGNTVVQMPCRDGQAALRWSSSTPAHIVKAGHPVTNDHTTVKLGKQNLRTTGSPSGYIHFQNGGSCMTAEGTEQEHTLGIKLMMEACDDHPRKEWKVVSNDGDYFQVMNRASGHCLHFTKPDANPDVAEAEWWACNSSDQQALRIIPSVKPQYHKIDAILKTPMATRCLEVSETPYQEFHFATKEVHQADCTGKDAQRWNYVETIDGRIKFINKKTGLCLYPVARRAGAKVIEAGCDASHDTFWMKAEVPGGFQIQNLGAKLCLGTKDGSLAGNVPIVLEPCKLGQNQVWDFGDKDFNFVWKLVKPNTKIPLIKFIAATRKAGASEPSTGGSLDGAAESSDNDIKVCRAQVNKGIYPGTLSGSECQVAAQNKAHDTQEFEVLTNVTTPHWRPVKGDDFPIGAIPAGRSDGDGFVAYICRAQIAGETYVGNAIKNTCSFNVSGGVKTATFFEVLSLH